MKNIMFIAPPAAGKGTQAEIIVKKYHLPHISTGDILREISKEDSEVGNYVRETLKSGGLVKDEITYQLIEDRLAKDDCKNGSIIDGFPRNLEQAKEYDKILEKLGYDIGTASSPKQASVCDKCGGKLYQRDDDNLESFNNRYNMYIEKTEPIIDYYEKKGVLHKVNGASSIDEVAEEVDRVISND